MRKVVVTTTAHRRAAEHAEEETRRNERTKSNAGERCACTRVPGVGAFYPLPPAHYSLVSHSASSILEYSPEAYKRN